MAISVNINDEWDNFISSDYDGDSSDEEENHIIKHIPEEIISSNVFNEFNSESPKCSDIYISTKTKIAYLNQVINLSELFWNIPIIQYAKPCNGVVKKQMKFNSLSIEELDFIKDKLKDEKCYDEHIITSINNPSGRIKFKDIRKVSIGISKKDLISYRSKKKSAFYNCFVLILRMKVNELFKEFHVKVFNTGKLEIPGVQNETSFKMVLSLLIDTLQPYVSEKLEYKENSEETVLINSNFNCGFFINREALYDILKMKYNIQTIYDPCSYPGIQCKFYYNPSIDIQTGSQISSEYKLLHTDITQVSFMIFRTGSVLIVGKCDENVLFIIYDYLKTIFTNEYSNICQPNIKPDELDSVIELKDKKKKARRRNITINIIK
uniref:Uncharacterized protein n=1 Tax=viral metagenome TaxID=1070528 RepID=A0A6C0ERL6_9ZZZZ